MALNSLLVNSEIHGCSGNHNVLELAPGESVLFSLSNVQLQLESYPLKYLVEFAHAGRNFSNLRIKMSSKFDMPVGNLIITAVRVRKQLISDLSCFNEWADCIHSISHHTLPL